MTYYALGFGHRDGDAWVREIIRGHHLRPKLVVANVDGFFAAISANGPSVFARTRPSARESADARR